MIFTCDVSERILREVAEFHYWMYNFSDDCPEQIEKEVQYAKSHKIEFHEWEEMLKYHAKEF